ncbi:MAG: alpha/beta fold hydrolase [Planctomycetota bacterium]
MRFPALTRLRERLDGHARTILPAALDWLPRRDPGGRYDFRVPIVDDCFGHTSLSVTLREAVGGDAARAAVLLVHGLGGHRHAGYLQRAGQKLRQMGFATVSVDLRGADRRGGGFYHVAQHEDLQAVCAAPELRAYRRLFVLGFSMGGHTAIHLAASGQVERLLGIAALCTPLDLGALQKHIDAPARAAYRRYVLRGLKQIYAAVAARHDVPSPKAAVLRCRTFHAWDALTITKRYGYATPEDFYRAKSAAEVLPKLRTDTVLLMARHDPIVPPALSMPFLDRAPPGRLHARILARGGHLQFASGQRLGLPGVAGPGAIEQIAEHWLQLLENAPVPLAGQAVRATHQPRPSQSRRLARSKPLR